MTSGDVKQMVCKTVTLFSIKTPFSSSQFSCQVCFFKIYVFILICQVFVLCLLWHIVEHLGPKISVHAIVTLNEKIKRNPYIQGPCCMGALGAARAENISYSILQPL